MDELLLCLQDTSWLDIYLSHIPHVVYQVDDPENTIGAQHATLANKGNEAMAYLQFIVDYYDRLPPVMVFLHGHRCSPILGSLFTTPQNLKLAVQNGTSGDTYYLSMQH